MRRIAVVTPYFRESPEVLARAIATVRAQTLPAVHYLVADGVPQTVPDDPAIVHLVLPRNVGNSGATPRALGAQLAFNDGCDAVAFLDADNWLEPDHLAQTVELLESQQLDLAFARRRIVFPDGEILNVPDPQDESGHVDTNCYLISRRAAFLTRVWAIWPTGFGAGEDRLMARCVQVFGLRTGRTDRPTVWYESHWQIHHSLAKKTPVAPLRKPSHSVNRHFHPERFRRATGLPLPLPAAAEAPPVQDPPPDRWRIAVVTPYSGQSPATLARTISSVDAQRALAAGLTHFVIGDARHPAPDDPRAQTWNLPGVREDFGNTARGFGAALAFALGYDAVAILDAGAAWGPGHLRGVLQAFAAEPVDLVLNRGIGSETQRVLRAMLSSTLQARSAWLGFLWAQLPDTNTALDGSLFLEQCARLTKCVIAQTAQASVQLPATRLPVRPSPLPAPSPALIFERTGLRVQVQPPRKPAVSPVSRLGIIVGAMKCATTALYASLVQHPEVCAARTKEPGFFSKPDCLRPEALDNYAALWSDWDPARHRLALEASTAYTKAPSTSGVPERIAAVRADAPLIYLVRDPFERIRSHCLMAHAKHALGDADGWVVPAPFAEGVDAHLIDVSRYASQLLHYERVFPAKQMLVMSIDEFSGDNASVMARVLAHLGLDPAHRPALSVVHGSDRHYMLPLIGAELHRQGVIGDPQDWPAVAAHMKSLSADDAAAVLRRVRSAFEVTPAVRAEIHAALADDMRALRSRWGIDVGRWGF